MKALTRMLTVPLTIAVVLIAIFLAGRYGWKLGGFGACQGAGITSVEVSETAVHITGFYPGSFPEGFCGYYAEERDGKLYVGFRFSAVFGFFETGDFDITIPVKGEITEVILKTSMNETSLWRAQTGFLPQSEQYGVYVKLERNDVYSLSMSCEGFDGGMNNDSLTPLYASFHENDHTFSLMWTEYTDDFLQFHQAYLENQTQFGHNHGVLCQPQTPPPANAYTVSCVPWVSFTHFAVHSYENKPYYFPSVEAGKFFEEAGRILMPLSITCHHATTDGYHIKCFLDSLQEDINGFMRYL